MVKAMVGVVSVVAGASSSNVADEDDRPTSNPTPTAIASNVPFATAAPVTDAIPEVPAVPTPTVVAKEPPLVRRKIPYVVVAKQGANLKSDPSKFSLGKSYGRGITLDEGETLSVIGRYIYPEGQVALLRTLDGWVQESSNASLVHKTSSALVLPKADDKIIAIRILRYSMPQPKEVGFFESLFGNNDKKFRLVLNIELQYPRDHVLHISRDLSDILKLREALMNSAAHKKLAFITFPTVFSELEGKEEFVNDVQTFLSFVDAVEEWLGHILRKPEFYKVAEVKNFVIPTEEDIAAMHVELMAVGGLGGAYATEMTVEDLPASA